MTVARRNTVTLADSSVPHREEWQYNNDPVVAGDVFRVADALRLTLKPAA
jgi:hypothetical protein